MQKCKNEDRARLLIGVWVFFLLAYGEEKRLCGARREEGFLKKEPKC